MPEPENDETETDETTEATTTEEAVEDPTAKLQKALKSERDARKSAERERNTLKQQLADKDKPAGEQALADARREAEKAVIEKANVRIVKAELRAAAAGKVKNPAIALRLVDTADIDVSDDGEVDAKAVEQAITDLLEEYPELAIDPKLRGSADQGRKGEKPPPKPPSFNDIVRAARN